MSVHHHLIVSQLHFQGKTEVGTLALKIIDFQENFLFCSIWFSELKLTWLKQFSRSFLCLHCLSKILFIQGFRADKIFGVCKLNKANTSLYLWSTSLTFKPFKTCNLFETKFDLFLNTGVARYKFPRYKFSLVIGSKISAPSIQPANKSPSI